MKRPSTGLEQIFPGDSELAGLMRKLDWSQTDLGPPERWPATWRKAVSLCVTSRIPVVLYLGPQFTVLYNDPYISFLGRTKHPRFLGRPGSECWREIWDTIGPMLASVYDTGTATWSEDLLMFFARDLPLEEVYVRFTFGPILSADGQSVDGIFCPCTETTEQVVGARRLETLRKLGVRGSEAHVRTVEATYQDTVDVLSQNLCDIPFSVVYAVDQNGTRATLKCVNGFELDHPFPSSVFREQQDEGPWPLATALRTFCPTNTEDLNQKGLGLPGGPWPDSASKAIILPVFNATHDAISALLILGINPRRVLDEAYHTFFDLIAAHVGTLISEAQAYEAECRRAEALVELDKAKTAFFSNVSHEFRTPLTLMLGPVEDLLAKSHQDLSPSAKGQLEVVHRNSLRLLRLVNSLLDFSRIEAGRVHAVYQPTDLSALTVELVSCFRAATERAGLRLIVDCPSFAEPVYVDRGMWEKIVLNLVSNAFKFTFEGEIAVSIRQRDDMAELIVRDSGVGIPAEAMPRIFERFYRIHNMRSRTHEGTGIGLALVQELVKLHGGSVRVQSTIGEGSSFIVMVRLGTAHLPPDQLGVHRSQTSTAMGAEPFVQEALRWLPDMPDIDSHLATETLRSNVLAVPDSPGRDAEATHQPSILIADDNADMRQYIVRLLAEEYRVEAVANGEAALAAVGDHRPDLIVSDVMMPRLDGFGLLRELRTNTATKTIPIILLSARAGEESRVEGLESGADDYLIKPFSAKELLARVKAHLDLARLRQETEARTAADLQAMTQLYEIGNHCVRAGNDLTACLTSILDTAIRFTGADKGNLQVLDRSAGVLTIQVQRGFDEPFLTFFAPVHDDDRAACGSAMRLGKRVIVEDIMLSELFRGQPSLTVLLEAGVRAVQSTPLISSSGAVLGMISTHFAVPYKPGDRELRLMDLLARQAADYLERRESEEILRESKARLHAFADQLEQLVAKRTDELTQSEQRLRTLATELNLAEQRERMRLATDLHDYLAQLLVLGRMTLAQAKSPDMLPRVETVITKTQEVLDKALNYCRTLMSELSPPVLREGGLADGLIWLADFMNEQGLEVTVDTTNAKELRLPEDRVILLFQSVRELLINIRKHAEIKKATVTMTGSGWVLKNHRT